ncbi:RTC4-like domain-domain-containing protein [Absidia repens]|uniref:Restriction of telomere capping protein 4 n=1 Tax=Absidia repens TaxID=90262 RepID=A0A1X2IVG4_9FUNG|nr:RTC4-like domain-domain-containing protein [Absidia repens]
MEQFTFCQLHTIELVLKPEGDERNWPSVITFENLLDRILGFKDELDMVIAKKLDSSYRASALAAYENMGMHKARSTMGMMTRFETVLPGYYGTKGAAIIQEHLAALYLHQDKLGRDVIAPQTAMEYLQQVLIPEVGFRLIREDLMNRDSRKRHEADIDDQAKRIMAESAAYGSSLHPVDWNDAISADEDSDDTNDGNDAGDFYGNIDDHIEQTEIL